MNNHLPLYSEYSPELQNSISQRLIILGNDYKPRTQHLNKDGSPIYINELIFEESPYLLQHAHNPVNWHAWSPKSFKLAKKSNKPIFLSIGYATCHWCHVMEHESFENIKIAKYINEHFIAIKVDRERRTAVDTYYMTGVQIMTGHGGWPMSNFITPDGKPFFGGTYYNPTQFINLLKRVNNIWATQEIELRKQALKMDIAINKYLTKSEKAQSINDTLYHAANENILNHYDEMLGGFTAAPKFPQEPWLLYLLTQDNDDINEALQHTLNAMKQGGIYDQIGGGFHRYATDNEWLTPHFEKMLYNQSQLSEIYTIAAEKFNNPEYKRIAVEILDYVLMEMSSKDGPFYSASDADSEGKEGLFFTWTDDELKNTLTKDEYLWLKNIYQFNTSGNFEGRNILFLSETLKQLASKQNMIYENFVKKLTILNHKLYKVRKLRVQPLIDTKVITSWNAQMVSSLAHASIAFDKPNYLDSALTAMYELLKTQINQKNQLMRNSLDGKTSNIAAELEDFAWMITAVIKLYDATSNRKWLNQANIFIKQTEELFYDNNNGGFFDNIPEQGIPNNSRIKHNEDGAMVSANGQILIALALYIHRTGDVHIDELFNQSFAAASGQAVKKPLSYTSMLRAKELYDNGENSNLTYAGKGHVKILTERKDNKIVLQFNIDNNWHINSNNTSIDSIIPLSIESKGSLKFIYPQASIKIIDFNDKNLSTFEGKLKVTSRYTKDTIFPLQLNVKLQTCSSKVCLAPSTIKVMVY
jgi:hypothetical protein